MPNTRYIRLQDLIFDSFVLNAPVEIEKGALLLDSQSKAVLLQLKLNILVEDKSKISSVKLKIFGFDDAGIPIEGFSPYSFTYRDIYLNPNKSFGEKTPIILNPAIRKVKVEIENVVYRNGDIWKNSEEEIKLPSLKTIDQLDSELNEQLSREITNFTPDQKKRVIYLPQQLDNYWICMCGRPNSNHDTYCRRCGMNKDFVFSKLSEDKLRYNLNIYNNDIIKFEIKKSKNKKKVLHAVIAIASIVLLLFILISLPTTRYVIASNALKLKQYDTAITLLSSLENFNDSSIMLKESYYLKAMERLEKNDYHEAINILQSLGEYKESSAVLANYQLQVEGGMVKTSFSKDENFALDIYITKGIPEESYDLGLIWELPSTTHTARIFGAKIGDNLSCFDSYSKIESRKPGKGKVTIINLNTKEVLAVYEFNIK